MDDWEDPFDNDDDNDTDSEYPSEVILDVFYYEEENKIVVPYLDEKEECMQNHGKYSVGTYVLSRDMVLENDQLVEYEPKLFHGISILSKTFFHFPIENVYSYLKYYTCGAEGTMGYGYENHINVKIHILQLFIQPVQETPFQWISTVVLKTFWISLLQRHWKKILAERKKRIEKMKSPNYLRMRELYGKNHCYPYPSLHGMLSVYK
jgi:hypothetical protein